MWLEDTATVQPEKVRYDKKLYDVINAMNEAKSFDGIFNLYNEILELVDAERMSMYVLDYDKKELFTRDRKSTRLNSSHSQISYAVFCLKKKNPYHEPADRIKFSHY